MENKGGKIMLYISSSLAWDIPVDIICKQAEEMNVDGIELWAQQVWSNPNTVKINSIRNSKLGITLHAASWDLNICSLNKEIYESSVKEIKRSIDLACALDADLVVVHPGRLTINNSRFLKLHKDRLEEAFTSICEYAAKFSIEIGIENMEAIKKEFIVKIEDVNSMINKLNKKGIENVGCVLDIAHIPLDEDPLEYYKKIKNVNEIHLSDSRKDKLHLPLGTGQINFSRILKYLNDKFTGPIVIEGFKIDDNFQLMKENIFEYRRLLNELKEA
jgi:sugar phosphate isomerase/epimerase